MKHLKGTKKLKNLFASLNEWNFGNSSNLFYIAEKPNFLLERIACTALI